MKPLLLSHHLPEEPYTCGEIYTLLQGHSTGEISHRFTYTAERLNYTHLVLATLKGITCAQWKDYSKYIEHLLYLHNLAYYAQEIRNAALNPH